MGTTNTTRATTAPRYRYHPNSYQFVFDALRYVQQHSGRSPNQGPEEEHHISGQELLHGVRELGLQRFGLMTLTVFHSWGVRSTDDFGRIVFELIERGEMRKTEQDQLSDFFEVYDFEQAFDRGYRIDTRTAFRH